MVWITIRARGTFFFIIFRSEVTFYGIHGWRAGVTFFNLEHQKCLESRCGTLDVTGTTTSQGCLARLLAVVPWISSLHPGHVPDYFRFRSCLMFKQQSCWLSVVFQCWCCYTSSVMRSGPDAVTPHASSVMCSGPDAVTPVTSYLPVWMLLFQ